jgi:hypothetical protein
MPEVDDDVRESRRLVRMYRDDVNERLPPSGPVQALGHVLSQDRSGPRDLVNPWRSFFEPWVPDEATQYVPPYKVFEPALEQ